MIKVTKYENVAELTFEFAKGDLLTLSYLKELISILKEIELDPTVSGLLITGTGNYFCTGLDASDSVGSKQDNFWRESFRALDEFLILLFRCSKPVVTAINGHSIGAGFLIQLCSDITLVANNDRIKMGFPELSLGLTIDKIMIQVANYSLKSDRDLQSLMYSSQLIGPTRAHELGVVDEIMESDLLVSVARERLNQFMEGSLEAFSTTKKLLRGNAIESMEAALAEDCHYIFDKLMNPISK